MEEGSLSVFTPPGSLREIATAETILSLASYLEIHSSDPVPAALLRAVGTALKIGLGNDLVCHVLPWMKAAIADAEICPDVEVKADAR